MQTAVFAQLPYLLLFAALLVLTVLCRIRKIPITGRLSLAGLVLFPVFVVASSGAVNWQAGLYASAIVLGVGAVPMARRWIERTDLELLAIAALWSGTTLLAPLLLIVAITPGLTGLGLRAWSRFAHEYSWAGAGVMAIDAEAEAAAAVPYSVAILAGGLVVVVLRIAGAG